MVERKASAIGAPFKTCSHCPFKSNCRKELKAHIRSKHSDKLKHKCDLCDFYSDFNAGIAYHMKTKHSSVATIGSEVVFKCEVVDEITTATYDCVLCPYESSSKPDLESHVEKTHQKDKKFQCQNCNYR